MQAKPTESELEILNILWERGPLTVRDVHEILTANKDAGYTTTLKLMQIMHEKHLLDRDESARSHVYKAAIEREKIRTRLLEKFINNVFSGSASQLVLQALGNYKTTSGEIDAIKKYLDQLEKQVQENDQ